MSSKKSSAPSTLGRSFWQRVLFHNMSDTLLAIVLGFLMGALALVIAGYSPLTAYGKLFSVIFGSPRNMSYSFIEFAPPISSPDSPWPSPLKPVFSTSVRRDNMW